MFTTLHKLLIDMKKHFHQKNTKTTFSINSGMCMLNLKKSDFTLVKSSNCYQYNSSPYSRGFYVLEKNRVTCMFIIISFI